MASKRQRLEQTALRYLQRGELENALATYRQVYQMARGDRRIQMAIADLHMRLNEPDEAFSQYRRVAYALRKDGQDRAAIPVFQQLLKLRSNDPNLMLHLGECYLAADQPTEARACFEETLRLSEQTQPELAQGVFEHLIRMSPGEMPLKIRRAEMLEAANWAERAVAAWKALSEESARLGRPDDQARFLERALTLRQDPQTLLLAAEARLKIKDPRRALGHLRAGRVPQPSARYIAVLAEAVETVGRTPEAGQLWAEAARRFEQEGALESQADALRAAARLGRLNADQSAALRKLDDAIAQRNLRLDEQAWAQPTTEREARVVIRAQVQAAYGFRGRARKTLLAAADVRDHLPVKVALAEVLATQNARAALRELSRIAPPTPEARQQITLRMKLLQGIDPVETGADEVDEMDDEPLVEGGEPVDDAYLLVADAPTFNDEEDTFQFHEGELDAFLDMPTNPGRSAPPKPAPPKNTPPPVKPSEGSQFEQDGDLMSRLAEPAPQQTASPTPNDAPAPAVSFQEVFSGGGVFDEFSLDDLVEEEEEEDPLEAVFEDTALREARGWVSVGMFREAAALLKGRSDAPAMVLVGRIRMEVGDLRGARDAAKGAMKLSSSPGEDYLEALWVLVEIYTRAKKPEAALKHLARIEDADPTWRARQIGDRRQGLELMARDAL